MYRLPGRLQCIGERHGDSDPIAYVKSPSDGVLASMLCQVASTRGSVDASSERDQCAKDWKQGLLTAFRRMFDGDDETKANVENYQILDMAAAKLSVLHSHYMHAVRGTFNELWDRLDALEKKDTHTMTTA